MRHTTFPVAVEIQTISACNAKCVICPHPQVSQELPAGTMSMQLFQNIIDQIDPAWGCRIIPYLNSEPLMDPLMVERLRYVSGRPGGAEIELSTNASTLNMPKQQAMAGIRLKELRLSVFGFTESTHKLLMPGLCWETVKQNLDDLTGNKSFRRFIEEIGLIMIDHPFVTSEDVGIAKEYCAKHGLTFNFWGFLDRSRNVTLYSNNIHRPIIIGCEQRRPLERMHITFTGDVILCCQDWRWKNVIGNVKNQTLLEIWHSDAYNRYRENIYVGLGQQPEVCTRCKLSVPAS